MMDSIILASGDALEPISFEPTRTASPAGSEPTRLTISSHGVPILNLRWLGATFARCVGPATQRAQPGMDSATGG